MRALLQLAKRLTSVQAKRLATGSLLVGGTAAVVYTVSNIEKPVFKQRVASFPLLAQCATKYKPQESVISEGKNHSLFLTIHLSNNASGKDCLKALGTIPKLVDTISPPDLRDEEDELWCGIGFGSDFLNKNAKVAKIEPFAGHTRHGDIGDLPCTDGDIFIHAKCNERGKLFELAEAVLRALPKGSVAQFEDVYSWVYQNGRDLSGFMDGIANPADPDERYEVAVNSNNGGSYAVTQRWIHNIKLLRDTEGGIKGQWLGRDFKDDSSLKNQSITSHVARMVGSNPDKKPRIVRHSQPYGTLSGEAGLFFCAYAASPQTLDWMLDRMTGKGGDKLNDDVMRFSRCVSSTYWYFPCQAELDQMTGVKRR